jgi:hypothetical protein
MKEGGIRWYYMVGLGALFLGIFCATIGSLGKNLTMIDENPVMSMAQGVAVPGGFMARLDLFLIAFWIVGVFCVFSGYLFYGNEGIRHGLPILRKPCLWLSYGGMLLLTGFWQQIHNISWNIFHGFCTEIFWQGSLLPLGLFLCIWKERRQR